VSENLSQLGASGLQFFGTVTASISHEIKNVLAVVNENGGLLSDLARMSKKGKKIEPERLEKIGDTLLRAAKRADRIVKNLNRFAHTIDTRITQVDLREVVDFAATLFERFASMKGVTLLPEGPPDPLVVTTHPFFLKKLLWQCVEAVLQSPEKVEAVRIIAEKNNAGACIRLTGFDALLHEGGELFSSESEHSVVLFLKAQLSTDADAGEVVIVLPEHLDQ